MQIPDRLRAPLGGIERLYNWWLDELIGLLPKSWQAALAPVPAKTIITLSREGLGVFRINRRALKPLIKQKIGPLDLHIGSWPRALQARLRSVRRVGVQLSPELVLRRRLTLPLAVEHRLGDALALQMDRHVPLRTDLAHLDHRVVERHPARSALTAEIAMAHRMRLDPVLAMLKGAGFQIDNVGLAADPVAEAPLNFLRSEAKTRETKSRRIQAALFGVLLLLALAGQNLVTLKQASEVEALQGRIDALEPDVKKAHALSGELSRLQDEQRLAATGKAEFDVLGVLNDLSARIPDGSWLTNLELLRSASEARLTGLSGDATALLSTLEASPLLTEARLRGPVTKDQQGRERFEAVVHVGATRKP